MRWFLSALIAIGFIFTVDIAPAAAGGAPFCLKGCDFGGGSGLGDCSFSSYAQCQASASGRDASCAANPYFSANAELQPNRSHLSRRRY
ncbi:DUF3551 domain-containing protein [Bradyrhizobium canariense]|uniref:DUF3551 domain-containing protein n=1 Tax=Bradyrhizobium canariense TaxID=255045 RepID=A0A1H1PP50_9BRAD|nr:DUF3551 domain-containing protein [Bradyrhizobium canariense]SDS12837.1 Protein of unknown function [Bradyrhizobium canariense]